MKRLVWLATPLLAATPVLAQSFNLDVNSSAAPFGAGVPGNAFVGAAEQPGYWNNIGNPLGSSYTLRNLAGTLTNVHLNTTGVGGDYSANDSFATSDFAKLMEDGHRCENEAGANLVYTFQGLQAGKYFIYTYADDPANTNKISRVTINAEQQFIGGSHNTNQFIQNSTHARHYVTLGQGQNLVVTVTNNPNQQFARGVVNGFQIVKLPERLYVDKNATGANNGLTWQDAFVELRDALPAVSLYGLAVEELWVADGSYTPYNGSDRTESFVMRNGLKILGGFAGGETDVNQRDWTKNFAFLHGNIGNIFSGDNSYHVVFSMSNDASAVLDGVTISSGYADGGFSWDDRGGGLYIREGAPTIRNCRFIGNYAELGGAVYVHDSSPAFVNCQFINNSASHYGGAICVDGLDNDYTRVAMSRFHNNYSEYHGGAVYLTDGDLILTNDVFTGNEAAGYGGVISLWDDSCYAFIANTSCAGNTAGAHGSTAYLGPGSLLGFVNSITWDNYGAWNEPLNVKAIYEYQGTAAAYYSIIEGYDANLISGLYNGSSDPMFVNPTGGDIYGNLNDDLRLSPGSPAIDGGGVSYMGFDYADVDEDGVINELMPFDAEGNDRRFDDPTTVDHGQGGAPQPDIGAYEFSACNLTGDVDSNGIVDIVDLSTLLANYGQSGVGKAQGDLDSNGIVDIADLAALLSNYAASCQ